MSHSLCVQDGLFPSLSPCLTSNPSIHSLNLSVSTATGEQVSRETAPDKMFPFGLSSAALNSKF